MINTSSISCCIWLLACLLTLRMLNDNETTDANKQTITVCCGILRCGSPKIGDAVLWYFLYYIERLGGPACLNGSFRSTHSTANGHWGRQRGTRRKLSPREEKATQLTTKCSVETVTLCLREKSC